MAEGKSNSRSEKLRANRENSRKRRPVRSTGRWPRSSQSTAHSMPPVLMRGGLSDMAQPKKKKSKRPKRRFDIALSSPGVEISLPAIPVLNLGWRLISAVIVVGLLIFFYYLWTAPLYQVQAAELEGNRYLEPDTINRVLNLYNKPVFMIDPKQIEGDLEGAFPGMLVDSSVQVSLPATVVVSIEEREPIIAWTEDDETLWVDAEGVSFNPVGENESLITVIASGQPPAPIIIEDEKAAVDDADEIIEENLGPITLMTPQMAAAIQIMNEYLPKNASLTYDPEHGLGWHDPKRDWDIYFGMDVSTIEEKLTVYKAIKLHLKENGISPELISVEQIHAPYYRLEQ